MSESFRQQVVAPGLGETKTFLGEATRDLKRVTGEFDTAVRSIVSAATAQAINRQNRDHDSSVGPLCPGLQ